LREAVERDRGQDGLNGTRITRITRIQADLFLVFIRGDPQYPRYPRSIELADYDWQLQLSVSPNENRPKRPGAA
jgi:hypothetical protein